MKHKVVILGSLLLSACATGSEADDMSGNIPDDPIEQAPDDTEVLVPDPVAETIVETTAFELTQTANNAIDGETWGTDCMSLDSGGIFHPETSIYRVFELELDAASTATVSRVVFGVLEAVAGTDEGQPLSVILHEKEAGEFLKSSLTEIARQDIFVSDQGPGLLSVDFSEVDVGPGEFVVEVTYPAGNNTAEYNRFIPGVNNSIQAASSYISSSVCSAGDKPLRFEESGDLKVGYGHILEVQGVVTTETIVDTP